jgi:hypothetical protein
MVGLVVWGLAPIVVSAGSASSPADGGAPPLASPQLPPRYEPPMTRPVLRSSPNGKRGPDYSAADRQAGLEGLVIVSCVLTTDGTANSCQVIKALSPASSQEVVDWLMGCRWSPVTDRGTPIAVRYVFNFTFKGPAPTSLDGGPT